MFESHAFTRRNFLKASGLTAISLGGATFLTACGPSTATTSSSSSDSSSSKASFGDNGTMRVGMEVAYPPFNWQVSEATDNTIPVEGQSGAYADGYDIYFAKLIADKLDLEPVAVKMEFSGLVEALKNGQIDLIVNTPQGDGASSTDGAYIRKEAIRAHIPFMTTMAAAKAAAIGVKTMRSTEGSGVNALQDIHAMIK